MLKTTSPANKARLLSASVPHASSVCCTCEIILLILLIIITYTRVGGDGGGGHGHSRGG